MRGNITLHSGTPAVLGLSDGGGSQNQLNGCSTTPGNKCNLAGVVAIVSHGKNGSGVYLPNGTRAALPNAASNPGELENTNGDTAFVTSLTGPSDYFDDVVMVLAPDDLIFPLEKRGLLKGPRTLTYERLDT